MACSPSSIHLCQRKYALDILADIGTIGSKTLHLSMEQKTHLSKDAGTTLLDPTSYRRLVGRLLYLTITRPDLSYSIQILSQFMASPTDFH